MYRRMGNLWHAGVMKFQAGDFFGWFHAGQGTFPFTGGDGSVRWGGGSLSTTSIDFGGAGARVYAYKVTYSA